MLILSPAQVPRAFMSIGLARKFAVLQFKHYRYDIATICRSSICRSAKQKEKSKRRADGYNNHRTPVGPSRRLNSDYEDITRQPGISWSLVEYLPSSMPQSNSSAIFTNSTRLVFINHVDIICNKCNMPTTVCLLIWVLLRLPGSPGLAASYLVLCDLLHTETTLLILYTSFSR